MSAKDQFINNLAAMRACEELISDIGIMLFSDIEIPRKKSLELLNLFVSFCKNIVKLKIPNENFLEAAKKNIANSEQIFFNHLEKRKLFKLPEEVVIGKQSSLHTGENGPCIKENDIVTQILPIKLIIQNQLTPSLIDSIINYVKYLEESDFIENMIQMDLWKQK